LKSKGGTTSVKQQAKMKGYHKQVWYSSRAIANTLALSDQTVSRNIRQQ
jgi:hypothetical protein